MKQVHHIADFLDFLPRFFFCGGCSSVSSTSSLFSWLLRSLMILLMHGTQLLTFVFVPFIMLSNCANSFLFPSERTLVRFTSSTNAFACSTNSTSTTLGHLPAGQSAKLIFVFKSKKQPQGLKVTPSSVTGWANGLSLFNGIPHVRVVELYTGHSMQMCIRSFAIWIILLII